MIPPESRSYILAAVFISLGLWLLYKGYKSLRSGKSTNYDDLGQANVYERPKRPFLYWLNVILELGLALLCFYLGAAFL